MEKNISIKTKEGITMISLIVTIIILLILAGVTIAMLTNSGIIDKANDAAKLTNLAEIREQLESDILDKQSELMSGKEKRGELTQKELEDIIEKYGELQEDGDTIVTEYGNISLKEIMSGDVKLADTSTSGNENNSEEIAQLKQQIEDLKKQVETENNQLQSKVQGLETTTNELNSSVSANNFGTKIDIKAYTSKTNMFVTPSDGYIFAETMNSNSSVMGYIVSADGTQEIPVQGAGNAISAGRFCMFIKKGMKYYTPIASQGLSAAYFLPLI